MSQILQSAEPMSITYEGVSKTFDHFKKVESNLVKINLIFPSSSSEGIWAYLDDAAMKVYQENGFSHAGEFVMACLANQSVSGLPWGTYVPVKLMGQSRPVCYIDKIEGNISFNYKDGE